MDYVSFSASLILFRIWRGQGLCAEVYDRGGQGGVPVLERIEWHRGPGNKMHAIFFAKGG